MMLAERVKGSQAKKAAIMAIHALMIFSLSACKESMDSGKNEFNAGNYESALKIFKPYAAKGNSEAVSYIVKIYEKQGNTDGIVALLETLSSQGDEAASLKLGKLLYDAKKDQSALEILKPLAEKGNAEAQYYMGELHDLFRYDDIPTALSWYKKAAAQGNIEATDRIGDMYYNGRGVPEDKKSAESYLLKAANKNYLPSQTLLISLYLSQKNYIQAEKWIKNAQANGASDTDINYYLEQIPGSALNRSSIDKKIASVAEQGYSDLRVAMGEGTCDQWGTPTVIDGIVGSAKPYAGNDTSLPTYIIGYKYECYSSVFGQQELTTYVRFSQDLKHGKDVGIFWGTKDQLVKQPGFTPQ